MLETLTHTTDYKVCTVSSYGVVVVSMQDGIRFKPWAYWVYCWNRLAQIPNTNCIHETM